MASQGNTSTSDSTHKNTQGHSLMVKQRVSAQYMSGHIQYKGPPSPPLYMRPPSPSQHFAGGKQAETLLDLSICNSSRSRDSEINENDRSFLEHNAKPSSTRDYHPMERHPMYTPHDEPHRPTCIYPAVPFGSRPAPYTPGALDKLHMLSQQTPSFMGGSLFKPVFSGLSLPHTSSSVLGISCPTQESHSQEDNFVKHNGNTDQEDTFVKNTNNANLARERKSRNVNYGSDINSDSNVDNDSNGRNVEHNNGIYKTIGSDHNSILSSQSSHREMHNSNNILNSNNTNENKISNSNENENDEDNMKIKISNGENNITTNDKRAIKDYMTADDESTIKEEIITKNDDTINNRSAIKDSYKTVSTIDDGSTIEDKSTTREKMTITGKENSMNDYPNIESKKPDDSIITLNNHRNIDSMTDDISNKTSNDNKTESKSPSAPKHISNFSISSLLETKTKDKDNSDSKDKNPEIFSTMSPLYCNTSQISPPVGPWYPPYLPHLPMGLAPYLPSYHHGRPLFYGPPERFQKADKSDLHLNRGDHLYHPYLIPPRYSHRDPPSPDLLSRSHHASASLPGKNTDVVSPLLSSDVRLHQQSPELATSGKTEAKSPLKELSPKMMMSPPFMGSNSITSPHNVTSPRSLVSPSSVTSQQSLTSKPDEKQPLGTDLTSISDVTSTSEDTLSKASSSPQSDETIDGSVVARRGRERTWLPCNICGKKFDRPSLLRRHTRVHTGEKPHACEVCNKAFSTSSSLNTHRRIHSGEKPHQCQVCGKRFTASSNLYYHRMTHNKEKPHKCKLCSKSFPTPGDLKSHMYVHNGSWPFKCDICNRGFSKQTNLKNHLLLHSGDKPHECVLCGKRFALQCNLRTHIKTHQGEAQEECYKCGKVYLVLHRQVIQGMCKECLHIQPGQAISRGELILGGRPLIDGARHLIEGRRLITPMLQHGLTQSTNLEQSKYGNDDMKLVKVDIQSSENSCVNSKISIFNNVLPMNGNTIQENGLLIPKAISNPNTCQNAYKSEYRVMKENASVMEFHGARPDFGKEPKTLPWPAVAPQHF